MTERGALGSRPGSYQDWVDHYERAYRAPDTVHELTCPNCAARTLRLEFVIDSLGDDRATAAFWCGTCLQGLAMSPIQVPESSDPTVRRDTSIPNYSLVLPESAD